MITRIVKLTFKEENIPSFEAIFEETKEHIRNFEGCMFLTLYQDLKAPHIFFTYSKWQEEMHLENYRNSEFFKQVWSRTKPLFEARAEAWSMQEKAVLN